MLGMVRNGHFLQRCFAALHGNDNLFQTAHPEPKPSEASPEPVQHMSGGVRHFPATT